MLPVDKAFRQAQTALDEAKAGNVGATTDKGAPDQERAQRLAMAAQAALDKAKARTVSPAEQKDKDAAVAFYQARLNDMMSKLKGPGTGAPNPLKPAAGTPKFASQDAFVTAFTKDQGRPPSPQEIERARAAGFF